MMIFSLSSSIKMNIANHIEDYSCTRITSPPCIDTLITFFLSSACQVVNSNSTNILCAFHTMSMSYFSNRKGLVSQVATLGKPLPPVVVVFLKVSYNWVSCHVGLVWFIMRWECLTYGKGIFKLLSMHCHVRWLHSNLPVYHQRLSVSVRSHTTWTSISYPLPVSMSSEQMKTNVGMYVLLTVWVFPRSWALQQKMFGIY